MPSARVITAMRVNPGDFRSCRRAKRRSFMSQPRILFCGYFLRGWLNGNAPGAGAKNERFTAAVDLSLQLLAIGAKADAGQVAGHSSRTRFRFDIESGIGRHAHFDTAGGSFQVNIAWHGRAQTSGNRSAGGSPRYFSIDVFEGKPASAGFHLGI